MKSICYITIHWQKPQLWHIYIDFSFFDFWLPIKEIILLPCHSLHVAIRWRTTGFIFPSVKSLWAMDMQCVCHIHNCFIGPPFKWNSQENIGTISCFDIVAVCTTVDALKKWHLWQWQQQENRIRMTFGWPYCTTVIPEAF